jgi:hypothetical protein
MYVAHFLGHSCAFLLLYVSALARSVILARSKELLPLTIWVVDNSSSMLMTDGKRILETTSQTNVRVVPCSRWEELKETVHYHAQLSALLEAPTKFILLNKPTGMAHGCPQEMSIAERGSEWIQADLQAFMSNFSKVQPGGVTPLTMHLLQIYQSIQHLENKIVLVLATDGRPTDSLGYYSTAIDRDFENALRQLQSKAWVVIRLCTNEDSVLEYYQKLDDQLELSLEVLDDYLDEAKEVYQYNPWLTYSLCLHRCREMGMSCHALHRWLDWLDERSLTRAEIYEVLQILGVVESTKSPHALVETEEWLTFCKTVGREQKLLAAQKNESLGTCLQAFKPWNPIRKRATEWIDIRRLKKQGTKSFGMLPIILVVVVAIFLRVAIGWNNW